jgi:ribosome-associated toxin RatA of RatAB toxin-antitoxin module
MYALVADIESYGQFLPWCGGARIVARDEDSVTAAIDIAYGGVHKTFTTRNLLQPGKMMEMRLVNGPFRHLLGYWAFNPLDERASRVSLDLEFEFATRMLDLMLRPVFSRIANDLVDSFHRRADTLYGGR